MQLKKNHNEINSITWLKHRSTHSIGWRANFQRVAPLFSKTVARRLTCVIHGAHAAIVTVAARHISGSRAFTIMTIAQNVGVTLAIDAIIANRIRHFHPIGWAIVVQASAELRLVATTCFRTTLDIGRLRHTQTRATGFLSAINFGLARFKWCFDLAIAANKGSDLEDQSHSHIRGDDNIH